jgi:hypothetical protein
MYPLLLHSSVFSLSTSAIYLAAPCQLYFATVLHWKIMTKIACALVVIFLHFKGEHMQRLIFARECLCDKCCPVEFWNTAVAGMLSHLFALTLPLPLNRQSCAIPCKTELPGAATCLFDLASSSSSAAAAAASSLSCRQHHVFQVASSSGYMPCDLHYSLTHQKPGSAVAMVLFMALHTDAFGIFPLLHIVAFGVFPPLPLPPSWFSVFTWNT